MAKQDNRLRALRKGLEDLRKEGIQVEKVESPPASTIDALKSLFGKGKEVDLAIVFLLGRIADPVAIEMLTALELKAADREVKREIRRSLFKLAQKGLVPTKDKAVEEKAEKPVFGLGPGLEGYFSAVDSAGNRLVWLAKPQIGSGIQMLQGIVNDREGLIQVGGSLLRRKQLRQMMAEIKEKHGVTIISIPWDFADSALYEAFEKAKGSARPGLEHFQQLRAHMNLGKPSKRSHPVYDHLNADELRSGPWREASQKLLEEPEFQAWVIDEDWVRPYAERVQETHESRLVLNPLQKEERMGRMVRDIAQELFAGEAGMCFTGRMEDMALYLFLTNRQDKAQSALAVALALKEQDLGGLGVSFLYGLIQRSLAVYATREKEKKEERTEDSSLIIKP